VNIGVPIKGIQGKALKRTKKGILGYIEASDEQKRKGEEVGERTDDELQKRQPEYVEPYVFEKNGVFFSEGDGVEEKEHLVPVCRAYRSGNNKQRYLEEKPGEEYELGAIVFNGPWSCLFFCAVVPEKDICRAERHRDKSADEKKPCLEKQHTPVTACVSKVVVPERRKIDFTADVDAGKRYEPEQCHCPGSHVSSYLQVA